jgi:hydrogenase maturation protein HypF
VRTLHHQADLQTCAIPGADAAVPQASPRVGRRIEIRGTVQGVGFRPWVYRMACASAVAGRVRNDAAGVTIDTFGSASAIDAFVDRLAHDPSRPPAAVVERLDTAPIPAEDADDFQIVESGGTAMPRVSIPADLSTCPECLAEVRDRANRRYAYPFTNCTNCGPRFTIAIAVPYDRPNTTMGAFRMCPACQREYDDPGDRRFHAQPNACPVCGPSLELRTKDGQPVVGAQVVRLAAGAILDGMIVAIKGIGGFQLVCDATSETAVARLRARKHRDEKPFAVMVANVEMARIVAELSDEELALLTSVERPIVLARRRTSAPLAAAVAPLNPLTGVLLPNSPLHHLLLDAVNRPVVMTSGNLTEEPIAARNDEALERLGDIADLFVTHEREIVTRCDDSVALVIAGRPALLRRSRGYVPQPIEIGRGFERPVLACGGSLKNTFCIGVGSQAVLGPHIGDLENLETYRAYVESIGRLQRFLRVRPEIVAHDLHPEYLSTQYARELSSVMTIGVQHHHAHVASVMAEHALDGRVLGLAFDGTGYGTDGVSWGGELLAATYSDFTRLATFRPLPLAGADAAIRQPWRTALALVDDAFDGDAPIDAFKVFAGVPPKDLETVRSMIRRRLNAPDAHGVGRYFDAFGALLLDRPRSSYEGQVAFELNMAADPAERRAYPYEIVRGEKPWQVDLRPAVRAAVYEAIGGESVPPIAARLHNTVAAAAVDLVRAATRETGRLPIVLSGGCFQNARLAESIASRLSHVSDVYLHRRVPPGDGGLSLGQAVVANAVARNL